MGIMANANSKKWRERKLTCNYCDKEFTSKKNCSTYTPKYCSRNCMKNGIKTRSRVTLKCKFCEGDFTRVKSNLKQTKAKNRFCSKKCLGKFYSRNGGLGPVEYKGGWINHGYKMIYKDGKEFREHRIKMEKYLGRKLKENEHVHHIDGDKLNNDIENLKVMDIKEHGRLHGKHSGYKHGK